VGDVVPTAIDVTPVAVPAIIAADNDEYPGALITAAPLPVRAYQRPFDFTRNCPPPVTPWSDKFIVLSEFTVPCEPAANTGTDSVEKPLFGALWGMVLLSLSATALIFTVWV
jgi:hypothetical protein